MDKTQILKGILEGCILQIIEQESTYGYGILEILKKKGFTEITEGTIYPLLIRLEKQDVISAQLKASPLGPKRKYYALTEKGKNELEAFINEWNRLEQSVDSIVNGGKGNE